jgi:hypothetical protein
MTNSITKEQLQSVRFLLRHTPVTSTPIEQWEALKQLLSMADLIASGDMVLVPRERWVDLNAEEVWNAYYSGIEKDGKWCSGGISDAEWLVEETNIYFEHKHSWVDAAQMKATLPQIIERRAALKRPQNGEK